MSTYNLAMGTSPLASLCLALLGIDPKTAPRLRDAWVSDDGERIIVLTRTGGGNRSSYEEENAKLTQVEGFIADHDDIRDNTFAHFVYEAPEAHKADLKIAAEFLASIGQGAESRGPSAMITKLQKRSAFQAEVDLEAPLAQAAMAAVERLGEAVSNGASPKQG
jgi:hypothetical protein